MQNSNQNEATATTIINERLVANSGRDIDNYIFIRILVHSIRSLLFEACWFTV